MVNGHSFVTGGNDDQEHFFEPYHQSEHLTGHTGETGNVYNMLKLTRHLFTRTADEKYAAFYEGALYNHILGSQDPNSGMVCYFIPLEPGAFKLYSTKANSFWCSVGKGFENHAKYGEGIYYHDDTGIFVNLFIPSEVSWKEKGIKLMQETGFPEEPSSYTSINRKWSNNDQVVAAFSIPLQWVPTPSDSTITAVTCGPIVLADPSGTEGMVPPAPFSDPNVHYDYYRFDFKIPTSVTKTPGVNPETMDTGIRPVSNEKLTFRSAKDGIILKPLYQIHHQHYVVYWNLN